VRGKRRLKGERGLKVMVGLWLLVFDGVGSGDEETQYYIRNRPKQTKNLLTGESISLLSQNLSPFQNPKSNLIVFCAFISSRKALVVRSQIES
jgi:hypothetical protein